MTPNKISALLLFGLFTAYIGFCYGEAHGTNTTMDNFRRQVRSHDEFYQHNSTAQEEGYAKTTGR